IDPSLAVTKSAMIEKGRSSPGRGSSLGPIEHVLPDEGTSAADPSIDPHSCREALQIVLQILLECLQRLTIHPRSTLILLHFDPGVPHLRLRDVERLAR